MSTILTNKIETKSGGLTLDPGAGGSVTVLGSLSGTITTAAQTNITSVGTLSSLAVSGDVSIADKIVHTGDTNTAIRFPSADTVTVETAGSERLRIDSSGNALIGTTSSSLFASGVKLIPNGTGIFAASGANSLILNRLTSEGSIVEIRQASNVVGSINVNATGASIRLGGNAAANELDDYEEGTFTPEVADAVTGGNLALGGFTGYYTKIGRLVTVTVELNNIDTSGMTSANGLFVRNLPFTALQFSSYGPVVVHNISFANASYTFMTVNSPSGTNFATIRQCGESVADFITTVSLVDAATSDIYFSLSYSV